jgi:hypothetical protein
MLGTKLFQNLCKLVVVWLFKLTKKLLCLNFTKPFWEIIRGPLILVHMLRGTFVPEKIRQKIMMRHFYTCSFPARSPLTGTVSACKPVYTRSGFFDTNGQKKLWLLGLLEESLFDLIFAAVISFQCCIWDHNLKKMYPLLSILCLLNLSTCFGRPVAPSAATNQSARSAAKSVTKKIISSVLSCRTH